MGNRKSRILLAIAVGVLSVIGTSGAAQAQSGTEVSAADRRANPAHTPAAARDRAGRSAAATAADAGPLHIVNRHSGRCLTVQNASTANNARALQFGCEYTAPFNEDWFLEDLSSADPYYHIVNSHSGRCLTVQNASTANNALALQFACDYSAPFNEEWYLVDLSTADPYYHIVNRHSGRCLTVQGASTANNALALQFGCEFAAPFNEEWQLVP